jgi:hypothetical protein
VNKSRAIPNRLTATKPMPTHIVSPLKIFLRNPPFIFGVFSMPSVGVCVGEGVAL